MIAKLVKWHGLKKVEVVYSNSETEMTNPIDLGGILLDNGIKFNIVKDINNLVMDKSVDNIYLGALGNVLFTEQH